MSFEKFKKGDRVLIHNIQGEDIGNFETNIVTYANPENMSLQYPLYNNYKDSKVIKIPQHTSLTIEKDVKLFHNAESNTGIFGYIANAGFSIKGYIADKSMESNEETQDIKMKKSKAGIYFGLANYHGSIARKVYDLKFTTTYPTITLPKDQPLTVENTGKEFSKGKFQHLTIPPDLNLHLTDEGVPKDYLFFKPKEQVINESGMLSKKYIKLLTITYPPIDQCPIFTNKKYSACFMIAFAKLPHWNQNTHFTLELFATQDDRVVIPQSLHKKGELGIIRPVQIRYLEENTKKVIEYWLQPFVIKSHIKERAISIKFW